MAKLDDNPPESKNNLTSITHLEREVDGSKIATEQDIRDIISRTKKRLSQKTFEDLNKSTER